MANRVRVNYSRSDPRFNRLKLLAFDTSTEYCSAAIVSDGSSYIREMHAGNRHSELLLPMIGELLAESGFVLAQLDGIAYGKGPGSFTGLRIGCGVAQGLGLGADLPVVGVVTLEAMAWGSGHDCVATCLDARMHEVYYALYQRAGDDMRCMAGPGVHKPGDVPLPFGGTWWGCGNGFAAYPDALKTRLGPMLTSVDAGVWPHALAIGSLAAKVFDAGGGLPADRAEPLYVRDKVALKTCER